MERKGPNYLTQMKITENVRKTDKINTYGLMTSVKSLGSGFMIINIAT